MKKETRKVDTSIKVGDYVRSFDFEHVDDCYVDGRVTAIEKQDDCAHYVILLTKKVFRGIDETYDYIQTTNNFHFYPPVNGIETWMGSLTCGVQKK